MDASDARAFYRAAGWHEVAESVTGGRDVVVLLGPDHPAVAGHRR